jgi:hypothetical protein
MNFIGFCQKGWRPLIGVICALAVLYIAVIQWVLAIHWPAMKIADIQTIGMVTWILSWLAAARTAEKIKTNNGQDAPNPAKPCESVAEQK